MLLTDFPGNPEFLFNGNFEFFPAFSAVYAVPVDFGAQQPAGIFGMLLETGPAGQTGPSEVPPRFQWVNPTVAGISIFSSKVDPGILGGGSQCRIINPNFSSVCRKNVPNPPSPN